ncbi:MAG: hypothetical protein M1822_002444 [Bathelium mastoideum]|nr:MAG: hypothetical protein M1822_002444 [Bathelium mastoideum]
MTAKIRAEVWTQGRFGKHWKSHQPSKLGHWLDIRQLPTIYSTFIEKLWKNPDNASEVNAFMDNPVVLGWSKGIEDATLKKEFLAYNIQDFFYLIDYVKFKALRLASIPQTDLDDLEKEAKSLGTQFSGSIDPSLESTIKPLMEDLGIGVKSIPDKKIRSEVLKTNRSVAELAYANFLQNNANHTDWFNLHVIMIACSYGWSKLAVKLYDMPSTLKKGRFFDMWIQPNVLVKDNKAELSDYANTLATFLDQNSQFWAAQNETQDTEVWNSLFRTALRLEVALFESSQSRMVTEDLSKLMERLSKDAQGSR